MVFYSLFFTGSVLLSEFVLRLSMYGDAGFTLWLVLFSIAYGMLIAFFCSLFKGRFGKALSIIISVLLFVYYGANLVYQHIFDSILSVTQVGMGPAAIINFYRETWIGIKESAIYLAALFAPVVILAICHKFTAASRKRKIGRAFAGLILSAAYYCFAVVLINMQPDLNFGVKELYHDGFVLSLAEQNFGALTTGRLEIKNLIFGKGIPAIVQEEDEEHSFFYDSSEYNALEIDFEELRRNTDNAMYHNLDAYFEAKRPTKKNEYTAKYRGYNLITILCESFSPYLIDQKITPTLYKLANEGISFNDYYSANDNNTSNSEYCLLTGLMPDETLFAPVGAAFDHFREYNSCTASKNNYLPYTIGNRFKARGIRSIFYHNYLASYYNRNLTHGNFGYELKTMKDGLKYSPYWPTSDVDLMNQAMDDLLKPNEYGHVAPFNAYFLTFSGHMAYNFESNQIAISNKEEIEALTEGRNLSEASSAYMAGNLELEKALNIMLKRLEEADVLDNTLIVLLPDHYPYGLGLGGLSEICGKGLAKNKNVAEINRHKGCLLMWTPSMNGEEKVNINYPVSELDILPTLLNLFGFDYDSRLFMGVDAFSDSKHMAVFDNRSFVTEDYYYILSTGDVVLRGDKEISDRELQKDLNAVKNKFTLSENILYSDYYRHVFSNEK